jgi:hypothetical protein
MISEKNWTQNKDEAKEKIRPTTTQQTIIVRAPKNDLQTLRLNIRETNVDESLSWCSPLFDAHVKSTPNARYRYPNEMMCVQTGFGSSTASNQLVSGSFDKQTQIFSTPKRVDSVHFTHWIDRRFGIKRLVCGAFVRARITKRPKPSKFWWPFS